MYTLILTGETLSNATTLNELGIGSDNAVTLLIHLPVDDASPSPSTPTSSPPPTPGPTHSIKGDILTTSVTVGRDTKEVLVKIERSNFKKTFVGGYRHRVSGLEYHHAAIQTMPRPRPQKGVSIDVVCIHLCTCLWLQHVGPVLRQRLSDCADA